MTIEGASSPMDPSQSRASHSPVLASGKQLSTKPALHVVPRSVYGSGGASSSETNDDDDSSSPPESSCGDFLQPSIYNALLPSPPKWPVGEDKSPRAGERGGTECQPKDGSGKKCKKCNCKNSRCLKLYCDCFAAGVYCGGCKCVNCCNNVENELIRRKAIEAILKRDPAAFKPKIAGNSTTVRRDGREGSNDEHSGAGKHNKGCHCQKTWCLKKYCECYQASVPCSENCKCIDCKNGGRVRNLRMQQRPEVRSEQNHSSVPGEGQNKGCHCRKTGCLKNYCECLQAGIACSESCLCIDCKNNEDESVYRTRLAEVRREHTAPGKQTKGCNCKKSGCLKKYCECVQADTACSEHCSCVDCRNNDRIRELREHLAQMKRRLGEMQASRVHCLPGESSGTDKKKRKTEELVLGCESPYFCTEDLE